MKQKIYAFILLVDMCMSTFLLPVWASSHREAPLISDDPLADNTDLYAFRDPGDPNKVNILAMYVPLQLPQGGPNFYQFGEHIRYEIHIDNNIASKGDDIVYRFIFNQENEDLNTFFNIRLGKQNLKTTYTLERSTDGGASFSTIVTNGIVPPPNVGPRSITSPVGLNAPSYEALFEDAVTTASTGEKVFAGTADDPFFVDLGGAFDLGDLPRQSGKYRDGVACKNVCVLALQVDISTLQKDHKSVAQASSILDPDYVIGIWASASRRKIRVLNANGLGEESHSGDWVQVSRLGMPLTNEVIIPTYRKDLWNSITPYEDLERLNVFGRYFYNPELALYMDDSQFGPAIPSFAQLRIQTNSLGAFDFRNFKDGLFDLKGSSAVAGTALDDAVFGNVLLPGERKPRSVDLYPIFNTGVPNLRPYQLAIGKGGNPLAAGKPFIHNFLPNGGDMLRLNMAVPPTPRNSEQFGRAGLLEAVVLAFTNPTYNNPSLQWIPNMDGFPNGRRLEDDVTRIELQAVSGIVLAAIGLWYDDFTGNNPITQDLLDVLSYTTEVERNDTFFRTTFPYVQTPWPGTCECAGVPTTPNDQQSLNSIVSNKKLNLAPPEVFGTASPNPFTSNTLIRYKVDNKSNVAIMVYNAQGQRVSILMNQGKEAGVHTLQWNAASVPAGTYYIQIIKNGKVKQTIPVIKK